ncbi:MAG: Spy/CpxP family protein refolding chaperone [Alphaproteobacteria bacterium]
MTRTKKFLLGTVAAVGIGAGALMIAGAGSQSMNTAKLELISAAAASGGGFHRGHHRGHRAKMICSDRRAEKLDDALGFVEAFFSFNPEQKTAWNGLAGALRDGSDVIGKHCEAMKGKEKGVGATAKLAQVETMLTAGLGVVRKVRPAFDGFYATLDKDQQAALDKLIQRRGRH